MDKAKIDAMRTVVDLICKTVKRADIYGHGNANTLDGVILVSTLRTAAEGLRELVDAAEAERTAADTMDADGPIGKLIHVLQHVAPDSKPCSDGVRFQASDEGAYYTLYVASVRNAVRAIKALLAAKPTASQPEPAEPTLEECVGLFDERLAAMNRAEYLRGSDWCLAVGSRKAVVTMSVADASLVGDWLIERERADAAKGGAA